MKSFLFYISMLLLSFFLGTSLWAQVITPRTGFNVIECGNDTRLCDSGGCTGNYLTNSDGYTVIRATGDAQITFSGTFSVEGYPYDFLIIYDGIGTNGTMLYHSNTTGSGTLSYTAAPGQSITIQLVTDGSVQYSGFNFNISFTGNCGSVTTAPENGTLDIACGTNTVIVDNGGIAGNYTANNNTTINFANGPGAILNLYGNYNLGTGDTIFLYATGSTTPLSRLVGNGVLNFNSSLGEAITMIFRSNATVHAQGFDFLVSYNGMCTCPTTTVTGNTNLCIGQTSTLTLNTITNNTYSISNIPFGPLPCNTGATVVSGDDMVTSPIDLPFTFNFFGQDFTQVGISTNGNIQLGAGPYNDAFTSIGPIPGTNVRNMIALNYSDWVVTATNSSITYQTVGTAPNRIFQVCFNNLTPFNGTGNLTGQILLYETTNVVEMHISQNTMPVAYNNQTQGLQYSNGIGVGYPGRNFSYISLTNDAIRFDPNVYYGWTPYSPNLDIANSQNPVFTATTNGTYTFNYAYDFGYCYGVNGQITFNVGNVTADYTKQNISCFGANDGSINLVSGSVTDFIWSNGATTSSLQNLSAGTYSVTASTGSCEYVESFTILEPTFFDVHFDTIMPLQCNRTSGAYIGIDAFGGTTPYYYAWSNGGTDQVIDNLTAGHYSVTVSDAAGCTVILNTDIYNAGVTATIASLQDSVCYLDNNGAVEITTTPSSNVQMYWPSMAGETRSTINTLTAGAYTAIATYTNEANIVCHDTLNFTIYQPTLHVSNIDIVQDLECNSPNSGEIQVAPTGGYGAPYTYDWSNGSTTAQLNNLSQGQYKVTITDRHGCTIIDSIALHMAGITLTLNSIEDTTCYGASTGNINLNVAPATANITWSNGANTAILNNLEAGDYTVTVSSLNASGILCEETRTFTIVQPTEPLVSTVTVVNDIDCIIPEGHLLAAATGGFGDYTYLWSNNMTTAEIDDLAAGNYTVTISDAFGCTTVASGLINPLTMPNLDAFIGQSGVKHVEVNADDLLSLSAMLSDSSLHNLWSFSWQPLNHTHHPIDVNGNNCNVQIPTPGEYYYLIHTQYGNCILSDSLKVLVLASEFQFPTAFTPNNDGENDLFRPVGFSNQFLKAFKVYNRWGQLVHESSTEAAWDGTLKGEIQPRDVYMYVLEYQLPQNPAPQVVRGQMTLLR